MNVKMMVIHMPSSGRRQLVDRLLDACPYPSRILPAVDGRTLHSGESAGYRRRLLAPGYPFPLTAGEIGCFLSHRAAWREIIAGGADFGLVFEVDDALFWPQVEMAVAVASPDAIVRFPIDAPQAGEAVSITQTRHPRLRTQCQLVGSTAARRLLDSTTQFDRPVDSYLQLVWHHHVPTLTAAPSFLRERSAETGGSLIQAVSTTKPGKLWREIARPLYRAQVAIRAWLPG